MARARKIAPTPFVRSQVRQLVREGVGATNLATEILSRFDNLNETNLNKMIREEVRRQDRVDTITSYDKRKRIDLRDRLGCKGKTTPIQASITINYIDTVTNLPQSYGAIVNLADSGRLADILNPALEQVAQAAVGRGYKPPTITSAQTSGANSYRINYVEC